MEENEKKVSKFSSGISILQRVDYLWKNCHNFKRNGMYYRWSEELDSVWLELARDLKPEEYYDLDSEGKIILDSVKDKDKINKTGYRTQFKAFEDRIKTYLPFADSGSFGFLKPDEGMIKRRNQQYLILMEKQVFLARLENELGKGTSWEDEDDDF